MKWKSEPRPQSKHSGCSNDSEPVAHWQRAWAKPAFSGYGSRMDAPSVLLEEARDHQPDAITLRRALHERPEIGLDLPITRELVEEALGGLPLQVRRCTTTSGLIVDLEGGRPGPTVLLRADMDALPMPEDSGVEFASRHDGAMHACGHDLHTAMLVGAAKMLSDRKADLAGRVRFMFQPGEEGFHGARYMLEDGLLDGIDRLATSFAIHVFAVMPSGHLATKGGSLMASSDTFSIVVTGRGGHGSAPHQALDPIPVACEIVGALQTMVTRRIDAFDPSVVSVTKITAGTTTNVIPETAEIVGTIRAVSERTRAAVQDHLRRVAEKIAEAHDMSADVDITFGYPVTVNHEADAERALGVARTVLGAGGTTLMRNPVMGAEDWSYVLQKTNGAMAFLGAMPAGIDPRTAHANHSNRVVYDESAMVQGMALYTAVALEHLAA
jgi:amidohydrolase